ncbi:MAG: bifunctional ornithine acetyltransferase/N-acetylglutamate synthase [Sulfurimonas sp. RIFCSPHIGHO2_12_FULL_36_9]|uniref:bifunctional glutamate N-acetyltransferase/amino-acid acetyltransferase ArgJ n=1 Tax=Sulfurimonas sp. RIFCSPLOWO2_12_36_12 TaxID=1802253 RepID=UPI0008CA8D53|nr:bifunctional glutamate N-acetyltransferase/amino-acid acetyltransferase ArgJ [Sulfurimonas sp. RIFCSPLOWO2_12_36_12]OHD96478.1 MAG: bifunctional ornithine acetyltransferase/N-acetylglutamate synthase [Sulfurimonas sp. RIFCSPHIGHO2_12_FULL_36_9]OHD98510.1 MAG: bifunctional ornithine acetyltransferase/N-acetylglutamate synthase [Sulfurimonas sp. RIFCSPLOWO2_02_FULL_36_28]OHE00379.1 MAG: bifunctional ornithine acetyltransferase/N-acetylglutamate synthase [Sulfurimonas sp. RIFCSPLOWO2_12_36_12]
MYNIIYSSGGVCASEGFFADGVSAGLKKEKAKDMAFIYSEDECEVASVFTTNKMCAAPIRHFRQMGDFKTNFIVINSKNANAMTGEAGIEDIKEVLSNCPLNVKNPIMSSTGVIGVRLPKAKIIDGMKLFDLTKRDSASASKAIMTTDTFAKEIAFKVKLDDGSSFNIGAIAKGAGMINPAMATMLCFITTDAKVSKDEMQATLDEIVKSTFNAISVDGDTSTNDTVLVLANGRSGAYEKEAFKEALFKVMHFLALEMVRDGEGATKLVTYKVTGAKDDREAEIAAKALSDSLLVKTALFGEDPNWGRIASTIGASGVEAYEEKLKISFDNLCVYDRGEILFDAEMEKKCAVVMQHQKFTISCDLGIGDGNFKAYGCDLGHEYVKINADYRT